MLFLYVGEELQDNNILFLLLVSTHNFLSQINHVCFVFLAHLLSEKSSFPLFPEYEIVTEPEEIDEDKLDNADEKNMGAYQKFVQENADFESSTVSKKEWELLAAESKKISNIVKDKKYWEFKKRISNDPDQVRIKLQEE